MTYGRDIEERTFQFAVRVINLSRTLPKTIDGQVVARQILRSGTSIGANVEESHSGFTRKDFIYLMNVALKEARETHYWLRLIKAARLARIEKIDPLIAEAEEIRRILGAIVSRSRNPRK